jgi:hypothetical protein
MALNAGGSSGGSVSSNEIFADIFDDASNGAGGGYDSSGGGDVDASAGPPSDAQYNIYKSVNRNNKSVTRNHKHDMIGEFEEVREFEEVLISTCADKDTSISGTVSSFYCMIPCASLS